MRLLRTLALALSALALLLLAAAGPGTRLGLWDFRLGFQLLRWAVYTGGAGLVLTLAALATRRRHGGSVAPLLLALAAAGIAVGLPLSQLRQARSVPGIHDITTDLAAPPEFVAVLPLRASAPNPATYGGDSIAAQQRAAYPDIVPLTLPVAPAAAFGRAHAAARDMGWEIVAADSAAGRIEGTATTRWFGFKDDVVVRVRPEGSGSRIDVRSVSRVGGSDVGANAARIRAYLARVRGA